MEAEGPAAQALLWQALVEGCSKALAQAAEQDKQQGQLHHPRVSQACTVRPTAHPNRALFLLL